VHRADNLTTLMCRLSINPGALTSRTPQGHVGLFRGYFTFYWLSSSQWPTGLRCVLRSLAGLAVSNPARDMDLSLSLSCECCVLSRRSICVGLISRLEETYRVWFCLSVIVSPRYYGRPGSRGAVTPWKTKLAVCISVSTNLTFKYDFRLPMTFD
jgi:hypothetical protein